MEFGIVGFGRFGALLAGILRKFGRVYVFDEINKRKEAEDLGVSFAGLLDVVCRDVVILSVPISSMERAIMKIAPLLRPGALVMDTCSVKEIPIFWMAKYLPHDVEILATHPLFGPDSARGGLYGLQIVFCPVRVSERSLQSISSIFETLGVEVLTMNASTHDEQSAVSLCLVHYLGRTLAEMGVGAQKVTTTGFERLLKIYEMVVNDTWELFCDMQNYNNYARELREKFRSVSHSIEERLTYSSSNAQGTEIDSGSESSENKNP